MFRHVLFIIFIDLLIIIFDTMYQVPMRKQILLYLFILLGMCFGEFIILTRRVKR